MLTVLVAGSVLLGAASTACPDRAARVELTVRRDAVAVSGAMSVAEIGALSTELAKEPPHATLGFYVSSFHYTVQVTRAGDGPCAGVRIRIGLVLDGRRIVLGREVMERPCLREAALAHYRRHADANDRAFLDLAARARRAIADPAVRQSVQAAGGDGPGVEQTLRAALERELPAFDAEDHDRQAAVDTPAEVRRLREACSVRT